MNTTQQTKPKKKTNPPQKAWHAIQIPEAFRVTYSTRKILRLELRDRSRWEFQFHAYRSQKMLTVLSFVLGWKANDRLSFPKTIAQAQELMAKREWYSANAGVSFCFKHDTGFTILQTQLDELAERMNTQ